MAYPVEMKQKVLELVSSLNSMNKVSILVDIPYNTISSWKKKVDNGESLEPQSGGVRRLKIDREKLKDYVDKNPDAYLREIAEEFNCSDSAIHYALKSIGYTLKKKRQLTKNNKQKR